MGAQPQAISTKFILLLAILGPTLAVATAALLRRPEASIPRRPEGASGIVSAPAQAPRGPTRGTPTPKTESPAESASGAPSAHLFAAAEVPGDLEARTVAVYRLAATEPGNRDISRRLSALTAAEQPPEIRVAAYTAFRFRRNDPIAVDALLRAFPGAPEPERLAAAISLSFQRVPGLADRLEPLAATEPSTAVRAALHSALDHVLGRFPKVPCLVRPK